MISLFLEEFLQQICDFPQFITVDLSINKQIASKYQLEHVQSQTASRLTVLLTYNRDLDAPKLL